GSRTLTTYLYDLAGNRSAASLLDLTTDYTAPAAAVVVLRPDQDTGASNSDHITNSPFIDFAGTGSEPLWFASQTSSLTGNTVVGSVSGAEWSFHHCRVAAFPYTTLFRSGSRTLTTYLYDLAGNRSAPSLLDLTTDYTAPNPAVVVL